MPRPEKPQLEGLPGPRERMGIFDMLGPCRPLGRKNMNLRLRVWGLGVGARGGAGRFGVVRRVGAAWRPACLGWCAFARRQAGPRAATWGLVRRPRLSRSGLESRAAPNGLSRGGLGALPRVVC